MEYGYCSRMTAKGTFEKQEERIKKEHPDAVIIRDTLSESDSGIGQELTTLLLKLKDGDKLYAVSADKLGKNTEAAIEAYVDIVKRYTELYFTDTPFLSLNVAYSICAAEYPAKVKKFDFFEQFIENYFSIYLKAYLDSVYATKEEQNGKKKQAIMEASLNGKKSGRKKGTTLLTTKFEETKDIILSQCKHFDGELTDLEVIKLTGLSRHTYYRYKNILLRDRKMLHYIEENSIEFKGEMTDDAIIADTDMSEEELVQYKDTLKKKIN